MSDIRKPYIREDDVSAMSSNTGNSGSEFMVDHSIQEGYEKFNAKKAEESDVVTCILTETEVRKLQEIAAALRMNTEEISRRAIHYLSFIDHEMRQDLDSGQKHSPADSHTPKIPKWENWKARYKNDYLRELKELGKIEGNPRKEGRYSMKLELTASISQKLNALNMRESPGESVYLGVTLLYYQLVEKATQLLDEHN